MKRYILSIGEKIKRARKEAGLSQKQLSHTLQISDKAVSAYEVGRTTPKFETIQKISRVTHKPLAYFGSEIESVDVNLQAKLQTIEKELLEIKQLLKKRKTP